MELWRQKDCCKFEGNLGYTASGREAEKSQVHKTDASAAPDGP